MPSRWKKVSPLDFQQYNHFKHYKIRLCARMPVLEWKERAFIEKVNSRFFCWFPAAILVHQNGAPIWCLHTKLYKGAWNVSANNSETLNHKDLRPGQIVYILVSYNISFSWLLPLLPVSNLFFCCVTVKTIYTADYIKLVSKQHNSYLASRLRGPEHMNYYPLNLDAIHF